MIYAIKRGCGGPIKIGRAVNPVNRMSELQTGSEEALILIACAKWPDKMEKVIHAALKEDWIMGEWFKPTKRVLNMVRLLTTLPNSPSDIKPTKEGMCIVHRSNGASIEMHV